VELYEEAEKSEGRIIFRYPARRASVMFLGAMGCALWWGGITFFASVSPGRDGKLPGPHSIPRLMSIFSLGAGFVFLIGAALSIWQRRSLEVDSKSRTLKRITRIPFWRREHHIPFDNIACFQVRELLSDRAGVASESEVALILREGRPIRLGRGKLARGRYLAGRLADLTGSSISTT
jgi:hypothetical protein